MSIAESLRSGRILAGTTVRVGAPPQAVWALWLDVAQRPRWHPRLEWARLDGPPVVGTTAAWKPAGVRPVRIVVTEVQPQRRLVLRGTHGPPVARGHYEHEVQPDGGDGSLVTHRMRLTGLLAAPIGRAFGTALAAFALPPALYSLAGALGAPVEPADRG